MELSEAKERVKDLINTSAMGIILHPNDKDLFSRDKEALETVLKALDNKYFEMVLKEQDDIINYLKSKLDNSISKDEVRECIEDIIDYFEHVSAPDEDVEFLEEWKNKLLGE